MTEYAELKQWCEWIAQPEVDFCATLMGIPGYFVAPKPWRVMHKEPLCEHVLYYVVEGGFVVELDETCLEVHSGSILWLRPGQIPRYRHTEEEHLGVYRFRLEMPPAYFTEPFLHASHIAESRIWFEKIVTELQLGGPRQQMRLRALLICLFSDILFSLEEQTNHGKRQLSRHEQFIIMQMVNNHPSDEWLRPSDLARKLGYSADYFTRIFRNTFGVAPRKWLVEQRLEMARTLLKESNMRVTEVAEALGYKSVYFFSRQFKDYVGMSPLEYRHRL